MALAAAAMKRANVSYLASLMIDVEYNTSSTNHGLILANFPTWDVIPEYLITDQYIFGLL